MKLDGVNYEMCAHCSHFVEGNDLTDDDIRMWEEMGITIAKYVHLDDGKEHDHDAAPSGVIHTLDEWAELRPELFVTYEDGKIGPNSSLFP